MIMCLPATFNLTFDCCTYAGTTQIIFTILAMPWLVICGISMNGITVITLPTTIAPPIYVIRVCPVQWVSMEWSNVRLKAFVTHIKIAFPAMMGESERDRATGYIHQFYYDIKISCETKSNEGFCFWNFTISD